MASYIEDCPVCCLAPAISCAATDGELIEVGVDAA
jgi:hypothetical protein